MTAQQRFIAVLITGIICGLLYSATRSQDKSVRVSRTEFIGQLMTQYNLLNERIKAATEERTRLEAQIGLLQGMTGQDSLTVPAGWVPEKEQAPDPKR